MYKVGDKVVVTDSIHGHGFEIGEVVKIIKVDNQEPQYRCKQDGNRFEWWLSDSEIKSIFDEEPQSTKHDGYVVIGLIESAPSIVMYSLTKKESLESINLLLKQGLSKENILVYAPFTNVTFTSKIVLEEE